MGFFSKGGGAGKLAAAAGIASALVSSARDTSIQKQASDNAKREAFDRKALQERSTRREAFSSKKK